MSKYRMSSVVYALLVLLSVMSCCSHGSHKRVYVAYMGSNPSEGEVAASSHHDLLSTVLESGSSSEGSLIYSYGRSFNGFAARLTSKEASRLSNLNEVVSVFQNKKFHLHTTRTWDFMGLTQNSSLYFPLEGDVIVGVIDSGIWPESKSFADDGMLPPPAKWKGICQTTNVTCNRKLIGARYYNSQQEYGPKDIKSPRDTFGHGTRTSSTAAGRAVSGANYHGLANGIARGAVTTARVAMYKVCWSTGCPFVDILAAFDDAIADGVDVISVSLGTYEILDYFEDPIAIGSFHAMKKGIITSNSAGNAGPYRRSVSNYSPWSITVAASSIDRKFVADVVLGNGKVFSGNSVNTFQLKSSVVPLICGGDAPNVTAGALKEFSMSCEEGLLNSRKVKGKLVLCDGVSNGSGVVQAGGVGAIMSTPEYYDVGYSFLLPATLLSPGDGAEVLDYIRSTSEPFAAILKSEGRKDILAPVVASFSSRGPNPVTHDILKPDLTAPGVNILAASLPLADEHAADFKIVSGTSISCPHVSGAAAYVKSAHPQWSPAAIKSALMTTANIMDARKNDDAEFAYGSGHINPVRAVDPGLVFDLSEQDYVQFLCSQGYNASKLRLVTGDSSSCSFGSLGSVWDLNYPSFALSVVEGQAANAFFHRTVTNVGAGNVTYWVGFTSPPSLTISVEPSELSFSNIGEKKSFVVTVKSANLFQEAILSASIVWFSKDHQVRTPLVVYTVLPPKPAKAGNRRVGSFESSKLNHRNGVVMTP